MERIVFLDTETTGLEYYNNQILQLSYIICDEKLNIIERKNFYLDVDVEIEISASKVHNITKEKIIELSKGVKFKDVATEIYWDLSYNKIICHNTKFDLSFIKREFLILNKTIEIKKEFCTMEHYTNMLKIRNYYGYKWPKLEEVVGYLNFDKNQLVKGAKNIFNITDNIDLHDSRLDVYITYIIYRQIVENDSKVVNNLMKLIKDDNMEEVLKLDIDNISINIDECKKYIKSLDENKIIESIHNIDEKIQKLKNIKSILEEIESEDNKLKFIEDDEIPF